MATDIEAELREDFLNESRDLLQRLSEQLVELERAPDDRELLNAIFRGFHTIKGSAGFFDLTPVVELAHAAEEIFGVLRAGSKTLSADMLDGVLEALDDLRAMLEAVTANKRPKAARKKLLESLKGLAETGVADSEEDLEAMFEAAAAAAAAKAAGADKPNIPGDPFSDDEFEALLDQLHGKGGAVAAPSAVPSLPRAEEGAQSAPSIAEPAPSPSTPVPHAAEASKSASAEETTIRVETHRLDQLMNLVGELVLVRNRIKNLGPGGSQADLRKAFSELDVVTSGLQNTVMRMRMQPIRKLFSKFPRLARDTARKLGKQVEVDLVGDDTELDKSLVEALADPLMHMMRNAVDHGLEMPSVRTAAGKPPGGRITLSAEQLGDQILITVRDDGGGMDPERLKRKALDKKLIEPAQAASMTDEEALQLVFLAGFSTKEQVSDLSGRGVGMDVVRSNILALNGAVQIDSTLGLGSAVQIRVPLTLAIQPVLMVEHAQRLFAVPLPSVRDVFTLDAATVHVDERGELAPYRDGSLRLLRLSRWCDSGIDEPRPHVVVVRLGNDSVGLVAGRVLGREEIVIKPLGSMLRGLPGVAGGTVTGEGRIALILELPSLIAAFDGATPARAAMMEAA